MPGWSMLPPGVDAAIQAVAEDRMSGASAIARKALDAMMALVADGRSGSSEGLALAARRLSEAQPTMAIVHNVATLFARLVGEGMDPREVRAQIQQELDTAQERIARTFLKVAGSHLSVVTLSDSSAVRAVLALLEEKKRLDVVYVLESRPLLEGRTLAKALADLGVHVQLLADAAGLGCLAHAVLVLVGADAVLRDGSVINKIGTYGLALAARDHGRPFHVACETLKFDARHDAGSWPGAVSRGREEVWAEAPPEIEVANRYFELTPARLITTILTERGGYAPDLVATMMSPKRTASRGS